MMEYKEGDILENNQGQQVILKGGNWVPVPSDYSGVFQEEPDINKAVFGPAWNRLMQAVPFGKATPKALETPNIMGGIEAFNEGAAMGFRDELTGLIPGGEQLKASRERFAQDNPVSNVGVEMTGLLSNPLSRTGSKLAAARPFVGGGLVGGGFGAIMGAGKAKPGERGTGALIGTLLGAPLGAGGSTLTNKLTNMLTNRPAQNIVRQELQKSFSGDKAVTNALREIGPDARLLDLNAGTKGLGIGASLKSTKAAGEIGAFLAKRAKGGSSRVKAMMKKQFGSKGNDFASFVDDSIARRAEQSAPLYAAARNKPIDQAAIQQFDDAVTQRLGSQNLSGHPEVSGLIRQLKGSLRMPDGSFKTSSEAILFARQKFGAKIFKAKSTLGDKLYNEMAAIRDQFDNVLPPEYAQANKIFSSEKKVLEAFDIGKKLFTMDGDDIARAMASMSLAERDGLYAGVGKAITSKIGTKVPTGKIPRALETEKMTEKLTQILGEDGARQFVKTIETEGLYSGVRNAIVGGSDTARKLAAQQQITGEMSKQGIPVNTGEAVNLAVRGFLGRMFGSGASEKTTNQIADLLISDLGEEGVKKLMTAPASFKNQAAVASGVLAGQAQE